MGSRKIDELSRGEVKLEHATCFVVDLLPRFGQDRRKLPFEKVHHVPTLRLPMPSDEAAMLEPSPARPGPSPPACLLSICTMGPLDFREVAMFPSKVGLCRRIHSTTI